MKAVGVIGEYNPFHLGHEYQLQKAKKLAKADVVVGVMSGNWLQRGEPAIIDKWTRAEIALAHGCDLVIELPVHYAVQSADFFAKGAITLMNALQVDALSFGSDLPNFDYQAFGAKYLALEDKLAVEFQKAGQTGVNYPTQMRQIYEKFDLAYFDANTPNHLLALSYAKEVAKQNPKMDLIAVNRVGQGYHEIEMKKTFASATAIRASALAENYEAIKSFVPKETADQLKKNQNLSWEDFFPLLQYQLTASSPEQLTKIYQMTEGLEHYVKKGRAVKSFAELMVILKTKRYSYGRLSRLLCAVLLQITKEDILQQEDFLQVLAFNKTGQSYLSQIKKELTLPLIVKSSKQQKNLLALNQRSDAIYQLQNGHEQVAGRFPVQK